MVMGGLGLKAGGDARPTGHGPSSIKPQYYSKEVLPLISLPLEGLIITHKWGEDGRVKVIIKQSHDLMPPSPYPSPPRGEGNNIKHIHKI